MSGKAYRRRLQAIESASLGIFDLALKRPCRSHKAKVGEPCYETPYGICGKRVRL